MKTPKVTAEQIDASIAVRYSVTGSEAIGGDPHGHTALDRLSLCIVVLQTGYVVVGKSMPASPALFDSERNAALAYDDAVGQIATLLNARA